RRDLGEEPQPSRRAPTERGWLAHNFAERWRLGSTEHMAEHPDREKKSFTTVDEYIESSLIDVEDRLVEMRRVIRAAAPGTEETISYNIPAYKSEGVVVVQFAGFTE